MTKLSDRLEALAEKADQIDDDIRYYSGGPTYNQAREEMHKMVADNLPTILQALKDKDL